MSEETDYSDGREISNADKAFQNKDVIKWMDRLERAKKFVNSAETVVNILSEVLEKEPKRSFMNAWMSNSRDKSAPRSVVGDVNIMAPVSKKIHKGDNDKIFIRYKEYPFYYVLSISSMFTATPANIELFSDSVQTANWFNDKLVPVISKDILSKIESELDKKFSNLFYFPKNKEDFMEGRINIVFTSSLRVTLASGSRSRSPIIPFKDSEDYREMLINELSVAIGRCIPPPQPSEA